MSLEFILLLKDYYGILIWYRYSRCK